MLIELLLMSALLASDSKCTPDQQIAGLCSSIENTGTTIEIGGTRPGGSGSDSPRSGGGGSPSTPPSPPIACDSVADPLCYRDPITFTSGIIRPTLNDVASFAPASLPLLDEPDGVGVVGMPMNFVVSPTVHEQAGELFDLPISVRFTPASIVFVHGDGTTRTAAGGGRTWAQLGLPQFSATATSHAYSARGTYSAHAIVRYSAEFNLGTGWSPIDGLLEIPTTGTSIQVLEVRTALVDQTCLENPAGPGCPEF